MRIKTNQSFSPNSLNKNILSTLQPNPKYKAVPPNESPRCIGIGTFGSVFEVQDNKGRILSLKKIIHDPTRQDRELSILTQLHHPNCLKLYDFYITHEGNNSAECVHLISDLFPTDLLKYVKNSSSIHPSLIKAFSYQIFNGINYLHSLQICHRDIKPSNILIDPNNGYLQICDFGSAKKLKSNDVSISYIATRSYRAPELLFGNQNYSFPIDIWAIGCVIVEMFLGGKIFFYGDSNDSIINIVAQRIGSPSIEDLAAIGGNKTYSGPQYPPHDLQKILPQIPSDLVDILKMIFVYDPKARATAKQCMDMPYFDEIRNETLLLPNNTYFKIHQ